MPPLTKAQRIADYEQALRTIDELLAEWPPNSQAMLEADRNDLLEEIAKLKAEKE
jgi:antitoxin component HigA of HigAB toxin-antitoxin module